MDGFQGFHGAVQIFYKALPKRRKENPILRNHLEVVRKTLVGLQPTFGTGARHLGIYQSHRSIGTNHHTTYVDAEKIPHTTITE